MTGGMPFRAVTLQLGLAAVVAGIELAVGPTLPICAAPRPLMPRLLSGPAVTAAPAVDPGARPLAALPPAAGDAVLDEAAWREILELRREHGGLLEGAIWQTPDAWTTGGVEAVGEAGWEEAAFGQALRQVMEPRIPR